MVLAANGCGSVSSDHGWEHVALGPHHSCGLKSTGEVECWGCDGYSDEPSCQSQAGDYLALTARDGLNFALRGDGSLHEWGDGGGAVLDVPWGVEFMAIDGYCGISVAQNIDCWSPYELESSDEFQAVSGAYTYACGLALSGQIECMGSEEHAPGTCSPPDGEFVSVSTSGQHACAVSTTGEISCWGCEQPSWNFGQCSAPGGQYSSVAVSDFTSCAIDLDGNVECWGLNDHGQTDAPGSTFESAVVGRHHSCGVRTDGRIECWGCEGWAGNDHDLTQQCTPP